MGKRARIQNRKERSLAEWLVSLFVDAAKDWNIPAHDVAGLILMWYRGTRIPPSLPEMIRLEASYRRAGEIADALLELDADGVSGLTFSSPLHDDESVAAGVLEVAFAKSGDPRIESDLQQLLPNIDRPRPCPECATNSTWIELESESSGNARVNCSAVSRRGRRSR